MNNNQKVCGSFQHIWELTDVERTDGNKEAAIFTIILRGVEKKTNGL